MLLEDGKNLIKLARKTIENYFQGKIELQKHKYKEKKGIFVSIHTYPNHELRGCIGFPYAVLPLGDALQKAAISAAFRDPRFPLLKKEELNKIIFEVSILSKPELITIEEIQPKKDGLIIENNFRQGLFLPQVWEQLPEKEKFLEHLCYKAGLEKDVLKNRETKIYRFRVQSFVEKEPNGTIVENINQT